MGVTGRATGGRMGPCFSRKAQEEQKKPEALPKPEGTDAAKAEQQAASEPAPTPAGNQQPVSQPQQPLVSLTPAADTSEPIVQEKFKNEMLLKQLYEATTNSCGNYMMPHFAAHMAELAFTSAANTGLPSYGKTKELEAFEKAGGSTKASPSAAAVTVEITLFSCRWMRSLQVCSPMVTLRTMVSLS